MDQNSWRNGLALFNAARFFDAHEALEDMWRQAPRHTDLRRHLQGLVQLAVAFHHQSTGNRIGARSVLERALKNLQGAEESFPDLDLLKLRSSVKPWRKYLEDCAPALDRRDVRSHKDGRGARRSTDPGVDGRGARRSPIPKLPKMTLRSRPQR